MLSLTLLMEVDHDPEPDCSQTSVVVKHPPALVLRRRAYPAFTICIKYDQGNAQRNATTPMDGMVTNSKCSPHSLEWFCCLPRMHNRAQSCHPMNETVLERLHRTSYSPRMSNLHCLWPLGWRSVQSAFSTFEAVHTRPLLSMRWSRPGSNGRMASTDAVDTY
jgi:hypothetical protein